jgi:hypothetical protein
MKSSKAGVRRRVTTDEEQIIKRQAEQRDYEGLPAD